MTPPKPCGTIAAYRRHLRADEKPCRKCTEANRVYMEERRAREEAKRAEKAEPTVRKILAEPAEVSEDDRLEDLAWQRTQLKRSIAVSMEKLDFTRVAGLSRELREIWAEIEKIAGASSEEASNDDDLDFDVVSLAPVTEIDTAADRSSTG